MKFCFGQEMLHLPLVLDDAVLDVGAPHVAHPSSAG